MQSILLIDTVAVKNQLEALPWVRSAAVKRSFPNELRIVLDEYQPAARWQSAESEMLIDAEGAIITENTSGRFARLPVVAGDGVREQLAEFWSLLETDRGLAAKVRSATLIGGRRWDLQLDDDVIVHLPTKAPDDAFRRLAKLDRDQAILSRAVAKVDLRSEDWIVVTPVEDGDPSIVGGQPA